MSADQKAKRFDRLSAEPPAVIPPGYAAPLTIRTTLELVNEREEWLRATEPCPTCKGHGRVAKSTESANVNTKGEAE